MIDILLIIPLAAYGFGIAIQMLRGKYLNFKPFDCKFCLSFWFSSIVYLYMVLFGIDKYTNVFIYGLFVACIANFLKLIEDKIIGTRGIL